MGDRLKKRIKVKSLTIAILLTLSLVVTLALTGCMGQETIERAIVPLQTWSAARTQGKLQPFPPKVTRRLQRLLDQSVGDDELPGVVLHIATSDGVWMGAAGVSDRKSDISLKPTDRFRIGNLTELFIAVICLQLTASDSLDLDGQISAYLPKAVMAQLENSRSVTVRQLLNHTSSLAEPDPQAFKQAVLTNPKREWTAQKVLEFLPQRELAVPKDVYFHSSTNYLLLQIIIEQVTGQPLAKVLRDRISKPLKLTNTFLERHDPIPGGFAQGYDDWDGDGKLENVTQPLINMGLGLGDSGIVSNTPDLTRFLQALFIENPRIENSGSNNALLYPNALRQMLTLEDGKGGYGFGIRHLLMSWGEAWGQTGNTTGFSSILLYLPVHDLTIAIWTNEGGRQIINSPYEIAAESLDIILSEAR
ncbi:MAG: beta-lactamase family protein [Drouetiella hepatica Uher 2000/2452]|jgi:D-alanyl-D-alanine carboxypeptidase|uniref:Beta-lactamase family protein n=1 Tax=Drouetiella hepatica Uher 2000/2452 TaxID=904376 RepID=A0A951ULA1_9CYAN|nr:beta-lactamase family protein [Drouetiella hepatica Uher 2000/2452]